jgi:hypothetical protein
MRAAYHQVSYTQSTVVPVLRNWQAGPLGVSPGSASVGTKKKPTGYPSDLTAWLRRGSSRCDSCLKSAQVNIA